jgi:hypothetical protein
LRRRSGRGALLIVLLFALVTAGCSSTTTSTTIGAGGCADVLSVEVTQTSQGVYNFAVTIASPDEGWDKYANSFEVRSLSGETLGTRLLAHPHVEEQPFSRSLLGVRTDETSVVVAASDLVEGFCGKEITLDLPE